MIEPGCVTNDRNKILDTFKDLVFIEEGHKYYRGGQSLPSVSEITHRFKPEFDSEKVARSYSKKHGETPEYWINQWKFKNLKATTTGTLVHEYGEGLFWLRLGKPELIPESAKSKYIKEHGWLIPTRPKEEAILKFFQDLPGNEYQVLAETKVYNNFNPSAPPMMTSYCGTFDILFYRENDGYIIRDYKGLHTETPIYTRNKGWVTMLDLEIGDTVYDLSGKPCKIIHTSGIHHKPCYKIKFTSGDEVICDHDHRWRMLDSSVLLTTDLRKGMKLPMGSPIEGREKKLPIEPYSFGCNLENREDLPEIYMTSSVEQRKAVLMGWRNMGKTGDMTKTPIKKLLGSLGAWGDFWEIESVEEVDSVPTKCIEVDSPTHTYLFGHSFIPTHNTNKELYSDYSRKAKKMCLPPFSDLPDEAFSMYTLQLSCYQIPLEDLGLKVVGREIIWLKDDGTYEIIPVQDMTTRIRNIL